MTDEDYMNWLTAMFKHNRKKAQRAEGSLKIEYWAAANAYQKALDVFEKDVRKEEVSDDI